LRILSSKKREVRLYNFKKLQYHGSHTTKMSRPRLTFQSVAQTLDSHVGAEFRRINALRVRREKNIDPSGRQFLRVRRKRTRVLGQIFIRSKLCGI